MYSFKWRRSWFWNNKKVIGHHYDEKQDKMILYYPDGGLEEIANWKQCSAKLGPDWALAVKKQMEEQAGQSIPLKVG